MIITEAKDQGGQHKSILPTNSSFYIDAGCLEAKKEPTEAPVI